MDMEWHIRLIDRMIKNNIDATIKDYLNIVDQDELSEQQITAARSVVVAIPVTEEYEQPDTKLPSMINGAKKKQPRPQKCYEKYWKF